MDHNLVAATGSLIAGESRDNISAKYGVSAGLQDTIKQVLRSELGNEVFDSVREVYNKAKRSPRPLTHAEVEAGYTIASFLVSNSGINVLEYANWLNELNKTVRLKHKMPAEKFAEILSLASEAIKDEKTPASQIPQKAARLKQEIAVLRESRNKERSQLDVVKKEREMEEKLLQEDLVKNQATKETLKKFDEAQRQLASHGLTISSLSKMADFIKEIEGMGDYPGFQLVERLSLADSAKEQTLKAYDEMSQATDELDKLNQRIAASRQGYEEYIKTREMGFGETQLRVLRQVSSEVMKKNGFDKSNTVNKIIDDISRHYDPMLGFAPEIERRKKMLADLKKQISGVESQIASLESHLQVLRGEETRLNNSIASLGSKTIEVIDRTEKRLAKFLKSVEDALEVLQNTTKELLEARQLSINSMVPPEGLAPIAKAMAGERVLVISVIESTIKVVDFLLTKMPKETNSYRLLNDARDNLHNAMMFPPDYNPFT